MVKVLLVFGGESSEHDVSVTSARNVLAALDPQTYQVSLCYIDVTGNWWLTDSIDTIDSNELEGLSPDLGNQQFVGTRGTIISADVIFPVLHGKNGEDGSVQALAQLVHIPVVGCDMTASAISMSKKLAKQIAFANGIDIVAFDVHHTSDEMPQYEALKQNLAGEDDVLFVKPDGAGSSVGVSRVVDQASLQAALVEAHKYDEYALIERALDHPRELEVAVLGNYPDIKISSVAEVRPDGEFYSYESKYSDDSTSQVIIPADIPDELRDRIHQQASYLYYLLGCKGMARIDFFVSGDALYFNEINTIPGFTNISVYPKAWEHAGLSYKQLVGELISLALKSNIVEKEV